MGSEINKTPPVLSTARKPELLIMPQNEDIVINSSILENKFRDYKRALSNRLSKESILAIVALWAPLFSSEFRSYFGQSAETIQFGYLIFAAMMTISMLTSRLKTSLLIVARRIPYLKEVFGQPMYEEYEDDPKKKVELIIAECDKSD